MQPTQAKDFTPVQSVLAVSLELSKASWKMALNDTKRERPAVYTVTANLAHERLAQAIHVIEAVKCKWGLQEKTRVVVIYEAGQDGFWIQRALSQRGYEAMIVDPASIPVERHARRAKTDRLDALRLLMSLLAWLRGECNRMHIIRIPSEAAEAERHLVRDRGELQKEVSQHRDRIRKLLRTFGCWDNVQGDFAGRLARGEVITHDGQALLPALKERLNRECERLALAERQLATLKPPVVAKQLSATHREQIGHLAKLKGIAEAGAMRLVLELFWRDFNNRRQVGGCLGLVPQPYDSGERHVDQGISKQGNRRVRALMIEMAWCWLRYQPASQLSQWFTRRTVANGSNKRARRIAIVAVARRLAIALWRYLTQGTIPQGAVLKG